MKFLLTVLLIFASISIIFRLFGRYIIQFVMRSVMKRMVKEAENQRMQYEKNYEQSPFKENLYMDKEMKVTQSKGEQKKSISADEIAEDIEFEEL